jgi:hypothetical protein
MGEVMQAFITLLTSCRFPLVIFLTERHYQVQKIFNPAFLDSGQSVYNAAIANA